LSKEQGKPLPAAAPQPDKPAGLTPAVELRRLTDGTRTWRIVATADDSSEAALIAARDIAVKLDGELTVRYDQRPSA